MQSAAVGRVVKGCGDGGGDDASAKKNCLRESANEFLTLTQHSRKQIVSQQKSR